MELYRAAKAGDLEEVRELLADGANPNQVVPLSGANPPYGCRFEGGHIRIVDALILESADVNATTANQADTALSFALKSDTPRTAVPLLRAGARLDGNIFPVGSHNVNFFNMVSISTGVKPVRLLRWIAENDRLDIVDYIIEAGTDPLDTEDPKGRANTDGFNLLDTQTPKGKNTLLIFAAKLEREEMVKKLLDAGADFNIRNAKGQMPLLVAMQSESTGIVRTLMAAGAHPVPELSCRNRARPLL